MSDSPLNVLKSYMVSIGYKVDLPSEQTATSSMARVEGAIGKFADSAAGKFAIAGAGLAAFVAATSKALADLTLGVASADLQQQLFARQMWMSTDAARAYQASLSALGTNLQSLYLSPELMSKFVSLRNQAGEMALPSDFEQTELAVRNVTFELQRLRLEGQYGMQWIGYHLAKDLAGPMGDVQGALAKLNDYLTRNMPSWTKNTADFLAQFVELGQEVAWAGSGVWRNLVDLWNSLGDSMHRNIELGGAFVTGLALMSNPITATIAALGALLLLIDDYAHYEKYGAGHSALPSLWKEFDDFQKQMGGLGNGIGNSGLVKTMENMWTYSDNAAKAVATLAAELDKLSTNLTGHGLADNLIQPFERFARFMADLAEGTSYFMSGDWFKAGDLFRNALDEASGAAEQIRQAQAGAEAASARYGAGSPEAAAAQARVNAIPHVGGQQPAGKLPSAQDLQGWAAPGKAFQDWLKSMGVQGPDWSYHPNGLNGPGTTGSPFGPQPQSYLLPSGGTASRSVVVQYAPVHQFTNVSSPQQAAEAVHQQNVQDAGLLTRYLQGVLG